MRIRETPARRPTSGCPLTSNLQHPESTPSYTKLARSGNRKVQSLKQWLGRPSEGPCVEVAALERGLDGLAGLFWALATVGIHGDGQRSAAFDALLVLAAAHGPRHVTAVYLGLPVALARQCRGANLGACVVEEVVPSHLVATLVVGVH